MSSTLSSEVMIAAPDDEPIGECYLGVITPQLNNHPTKIERADDAFADRKKVWVFH